jgi:sigma-B regulation protein RsbU (phosphoserine phosphatase)
MDGTIAILAPGCTADPTIDLRLAYQRLDQAYRQLAQDLEAARRVQQSFQSSRLPELPGVRFGIYARQCGRTGGDCYGAFRLDGDQVGFYLATVVGRGISGALLSLCLRILRIKDDADRAVAPDVVLQQLNRLLLDLALPDSPFVTMIYGILNRRDGTVRFARAGHPYPIRVPSAGPARTLAGEGNLLGVFPTHCSVETCRFGPGDRFLIYSDGLAPRVESGAGADRLLVAALEHRAVPIQEHVERTAHALLGHTSPMDDATLLAVELA